MDRGWMIAAVAVSAAITFFLRALPFFAFRDGRKMPEKLKRLGGILPSVSYKYRHHTMLSIALGTVCNIILLYFFTKF